MSKDLPLREIHLFSNVGRVLFALLSGPLSIGEVMEICEITQPTANKIMDQLIIGQWCTRRKSDYDGRVFRYYLNERAYNVLSTRPYAHDVSGIIRDARHIIL